MELLPDYMEYGTPARVMACMIPTFNQMVRVRIAAERRLRDAEENGGMA